jgi:transposase
LAGGTGWAVNFTEITRSNILTLQQKTLEVDLALIIYDDERLRGLELYITNTAKQPDANPLSLFQTVPGMGQVLSLVLLYDIHRIERFPSVQDFASYARLLQ